MATALAASIPAPARLTLTRQFWVICHRWAGLTLTLFLAVAGFTGIFLSWIDELDAAAAPHLHYAAPAHAGDAPLDPLAIREAVLRRHPGADVHFVPLEVEHGRSLQLFVEWPDPATGLERAAAPNWDQLFINPYTGEELGRRKWGDITQGMVNLMPFVYRLHYSLALGDWGLFVFGLAALIWAVDCFVGFYLTLPMGQKGPLPRMAKAAGWWNRWKPSWRVRWSASRYKLNFDLHRAGGLWLWPLLLVFAWSSVSFNLPQVYVPVMKLLGGQDQREFYFAALLAQPRTEPALSYHQALDRGQELAREQAAQAGLALDGSGETFLWHTPETGMFVYYFTTSADISKHGAGTLVAFDSNSGELSYFEAPTGQVAANTVTTWISMLHTAHVGGTAWRIAVSVIGALVTMLCVTGVVIWMRKRASRLMAQRQ